LREAADARVHGTTQQVPSEHLIWVDTGGQRGWRTEAHSVTEFGHEAGSGLPADAADS